MKLIELKPNAYYDMVVGKPKEKERDNDGSWIYRYNISPHLRRENDTDDEIQVGWQCREVRLFVEPTCELLKQAIIDSVYNANTRLDLISRYNAYTSSFSTDENIAVEYKGFIQFCKDVDRLFESKEEKSSEIYVPRFVTNRQFRLMLIAKGINLDSITKEIKKLPAPYQQQALISWEYAPTFERSNPMIQELADKFGFSKETLDEIFIEAEKL